MRFEHVWVCVALPLAVLPWVRAGSPAHAFSWSAMLPADRLSEACGNLLKLCSTLCIAGCIVGLAGPYSLPEPLEHVGRGAQIVILLDRSRSMDQSFAGGSSTRNLVAESTRATTETKGGAARRLLAEFARNRAHDLIGMLAFTTIPIRVTGFTEKQDMVQAAIGAGNVGRGLAETDIGLGLLASLSLFENQPYNGSRVILMVSDGGAQLDAATQRRIAELMKRERVALYWLYLRASHSPGLLMDHEVTAAEQEVVPEHFLHQFFLGMGSPYHAYEAENPDALEHAMADVDRLQSLPIRFTYPRVHRDLSGIAYAIALAGALLLTLAAVTEARSWR